MRTDRIEKGDIYTMMKNLKKPVLMLFMLAMVMLVLSACSPTKKEEPMASSTSETSTVTPVETKAQIAEAVKLKFYAQYSGEEKTVYDAANEAMKKVMPEVTVEFEVAAQDDEQKIKTY